MSSEPRTRWGDKPYYSLDYYLRQTFGEKIYKVALDVGTTCPNRDGTLDRRGCIFCSAGGSGDFAAHAGDHQHIQTQIDEAIDFLKRGKKPVGDRFIAYFQAYSGTYAPIRQLRTWYLDALHHPRVAALSIATRPDCFLPETYALLEECRQIKPVWIELGLQTIHERTAAFIRRGYPLSVFEDCVHRLAARDIPVIVHVILGLPGETAQDMLQTISYLNTLPISGIKLQLLHVLKGTDLGIWYEQKQTAELTKRQAPINQLHPVQTHGQTLPPEIVDWHILSRDEYIDQVLDCIDHLRPDIVIHRLTGDGPGDLLLAPRWSLDKRGVMGAMGHAMKVRGCYQGRNYIGKECHFDT